MTDREVMQQALDAIQDFHAGWGYIRATYGDLYGVGWNRAEIKGLAAIALIKTAITQPEQTASERELTDDAQSERDDWEQHYDNCSCHLFPPCGSCTHPGNPMNQEEDETAWKPATAQPKDKPAPVAWRVRRIDHPGHWIIFMHCPVDAMNDLEREVQPLYIAQPEQPAGDWISEKGVRLLMRTEYDRGYRQCKYDSMDAIAQPPSDLT